MLDCGGEKRISGWACQFPRATTKQGGSGIARYRNRLAGRGTQDTNLRYGKKRGVSSRRNVPGKQELPLSATDTQLVWSSHVV